MANADRGRAELIESKGANVYIAGEETVEGGEMIRIFSDLGYKTVYSSAGPKIHQLLIQAKVLDRTYLTFANRLLGGQTFSTIVEGNPFSPAVDMTLSKLYYDPSGLSGLGQIFAAFDRP